MIIVLRLGSHPTDYLMECNKSGNEIRLAYKKAVLLTGFDLSKHCNTSPTFPKDLWEKLVQLGFKHHDQLYSRDDNYEVNSSIYISMYIFMVSLGNPDIKLSFHDTDYICIGGSAFVDFY